MPRLWQCSVQVEGVDALHALQALVPFEFVARTDGYAPRYDEAIKRVVFFIAYDEITDVERAEYDARLAIQDVIVWRAQHRERPALRRISTATFRALRGIP